MSRQLATKHNGGSHFLVLQGEQAISEIISENLGELGITQFDLDRVKFPTGGNTMWTIPSLDEDKTEKELRGIIVYWKDVRAYWTELFSGEGNPPDCRSDDSIVGYGNPGGVCGKCPLSQFGSAPNGKGQACKQIRLLFLLREGDMLPLVIALPPTSINNVKKYFLRLASKSIPYWGVITTLTLEKTKNANGIPYAKVVPVLDSVLDEETKARVKAYAETIRPTLKKTSIKPEDYLAEADQP